MDQLIGPVYAKNIKFGVGDKSTGVTRVTPSNPLLQCVEMVAPMLNEIRILTKVKIIAPAIFFSRRLQKQPAYCYIILLLFMNLASMHVLASL